jgi:hypothetical protein
MAALRQIPARRMKFPLRRLAVLGAISVLIGCAEEVQEQEPDPTPVAAQPPPPVPVDYESVIGVAQLPIFTDLHRKTSTVAPG